LVPGLTLGFETFLRKPSKTEKHDVNEKNEKTFKLKNMMLTKKR
jgi:hypothetical protein